MLSSLNDALTGELADLDATGRLRLLRPLHGPHRVLPESNGSPLLSFSSNDYLGLANHPALAAAAADAAARSGFGASASRLVSGDLPEHRALEDALAALVDAPAALLFPSGYQANIGVITALAGKDDLILSDAANHASLIDGCRLSRAELAVYPHLDVAAVDASLASAAGRHRRRFIVSEALFSMDGDFAPLADLADLAARHHAALIIDEAHALGVLGPRGAGLSAAGNIRPDAVVGTLGKALGSLGGFVAGTPELRSYLINHARTFIFTTAPPAPVAAAALAAVAIVRAAEGDARRQSLQNRIAQLLAPATARSPASPIVPIILGEDRAALAASARLRERGIFIPAIRPPTVPPGSARLRVTLSASHTHDQVVRLRDALQSLPSPGAPR